MVALLSCSLVYSVECIHLLRWMLSVDWKLSLSISDNDISHYFCNYDTIFASTSL